VKVYNLNEMVKGWFCGNFEPSCLKTDAFECAVKKYKTGDYESNHMHKIATEYTVILEGQVLMNKKLYKENDIIEILPGENTDFFAISNATTVVIKVPCVTGDKYVINSTQS
jgi:mannose-6-phosphate isomerase-like protein (cupin superfamily)